MHPSAGTELEVGEKMSSQTLKMDKYLNVRMVKGWIKIKTMPTNINMVLVNGGKDANFLRKFAELLISQQIPKIDLISTAFPRTNNKKLLTVLSRANSSYSPFN